MSVERHPIIQEEERLLADVRRRLIERPVLEEASESEIANELHRLRADIATAKEEDRGAMMQQFGQLSALLGQLRRGRSSDSPDPDCPYFAHIRLREGGRERDLFLGRASRTDHGIRIVDWRNAPIAQLYYRYQEGDEYAEEVGDRLLEGVVAARRTLAIHSGDLRRIDCPQGLFQRADAALWQHQPVESHRLAGGQGTSLLSYSGGNGRRLGQDLRDERRRSDKHLPDIAALIDPEQFDLITRPESGLVVVRGIAGSGKTTVALHRIAWLAFQDPQRFCSEQMVVVVWGRAMRDYISKVLPALGVEGVPVLTWRDWSREMVRRHLPSLPRDRAEDTPEVVSRLKLHPAMLALLRQHVEANPHTPDGAGVIEDFLSLFLRPDQLWESLNHLAPGAFSRGELERAWAWLSRQRAGLSDWLEGNREERAELDSEDDALLLRLWQLRVGKLRARSRRPLAYSHMVIDEVQDLSPLEVSVLLDTLDEHHSATLAGDTQQHIIEASGFGSWSDLFGHLGKRSTEVSTLRVSYRSTHPITEFALQVLGPLREDDTPPLTARAGAPVELFRFTDHGSCVAFLAEALHELMRREPLASVAIITPDEALSDIYAQGLSLAEVPGLRRVIGQEFGFKPGIEVTEVTEVKGLEFDYVVLIEASATFYPENSHSRRLLHVGATRAAHQLWLTSIGSPSPVLRELLHSEEDAS